MQSELSAVLFDLDGVIHPFLPSRLRAWRDEWSAFRHGTRRKRRDAIVAFIALLRDRRIKVGVVTSRLHVQCDSILRRSGLGMLDVVVTWNDVPAGRTKPDPWPLRRALEILQLQPEGAVYVGDSPSDILAARRAGVRSVAVGWGAVSLEELKRWNPDLVLARPEELNRILIEFGCGAGL